MWSSHMRRSAERMGPLPRLCAATFSCDIARAVSRRLRSRRERLAPTAPRLRGLPPLLIQRRRRSTSRRGWSTPVPGSHLDPRRGPGVTASSGTHDDASPASMKSSASMRADSQALAQSARTGADRRAYKRLARADRPRRCRARSVGADVSNAASMSPAFARLDSGPTISTFSCDIARAVSRRLRSRRERLAPTAPRLRGLRRGRGSTRIARSCRRATCQTARVNSARGQGRCPCRGRARGAMTRRSPGVDRVLALEPGFVAGLRQSARRLDDGFATENAALEIRPTSQAVHVMVRSRQCSLSSLQTASTPRGLAARSPRSPATSPAQYPAGSGVGVSVLLRQARGFEGFLRPRTDGSDDLAVAVPSRHSGTARLCLSSIRAAPVHSYIEHDGRRPVDARLDVGPRKSRSTLQGAKLRASPRGCRSCPR